MKYIFTGLLAAVILLLVYFGILSLANSFLHALSQFVLMWHWILLLVLGFGIQVGLYKYVKDELKQRKTKVKNSIMAVSGGISTGSMIACCLHHAVDVLPILGLSALSLFLINYQIFFLQLGVASNIIGIIIMLEIIQKSGLAKEGGIFKRVFNFNVIKFKYGVISLLVLLLALGFINAFNMANPEPAGVPGDRSSKNVIPLPAKSNEGGGLSILSEPVDFSFKNPVNFKISFNTHQGNLDFDLTRVSVLKDSNNNEYVPVSWSGTPGGHHINGNLLFPALKGEVKEMKLIIKNLYGVSEREFVWDF